MKEKTRHKTTARKFKREQEAVNEVIEHESIIGESERVCVKEVKELVVYVIRNLLFFELNNKNSPI